MGQDRRDSSWSGMGTGWGITATLLGGILVWGAVGFLLDRLFDSARVFTAIGMVLGAAGGICIVYLRYGKGDG